MVALIDVGGSELLLILGAALVLLGPRRLPEIARQIGQINSKLRDANRELKRELYSNLDPPPAPPLPAPPAERGEAIARRREPAADVDYEAPYRDAEAELARERSAASAGEAPAGEAAQSAAPASGEQAAGGPAAKTEADPDAAGSASPEAGPRGA